MLQSEPPPGVWAAPKGDRLTELEAQVQVRWEDAGGGCEIDWQCAQMNRCRAAAPPPPPCLSARARFCTHLPTVHRAPRTPSTRAACSASQSTSRHGAPGPSAQALLARRLAARSTQRRARSNRLTHAPPMQIPL